MPWTGSIYRKGNYSTNGWTGDAANNIGIEAGRHDTQDNDFQDGISACINKNGANTPTVNLPMGGYKHTGAAAATANGEYLTYDQVNDGSPLKVDFANDRVGIGTTSPGFDLDVQSTAPIVNVGRFIAAGNAGGLNFRKSRGATVGTNTIVQAGDNLGGIYFQGANGTGYDDGASIIAQVDATPGASNDMPGRLCFYTTADGSGTATERMRINSAGNVGIGTTNPIAPLHVAGQATVAANVAGNYAMSVSNANTGGAAYGFIVDGARNNYALAVRDNNNYYRDIFNADGSLGIGAVSTYNAAIQVDNTGKVIFQTVSTERLAISTAGRKDFSNGYTYFAASGITSGAGTNALKYNTNDGLVTWDASSQLVKENIVDCPYGLNAVLALQPRKYFRTDDQKEEIGFVADELVNVLPEMVSFAEKSRFTKNDEDTELVPSSVAYDRLTSVLCKAIQELNAKVEALEARVAVLEG